MANRIFRIGFIGAGNVAHHIARSFMNAGHDVKAVCARTYESAKSLADIVGAVPCDNVESLPVDTLDLIVIATNDSSVGEVAETLARSEAIIAHTSGSVPLDVLSSKHRKSAVIYPLQTFSKDIAVEIDKVPFFIEATDRRTLEDIESITRQISSTVYHADSTVRSKLHIAGVLSSNFPIYLLEMARRVLDEAGLPLSTVGPLVEASIKKAFEKTPLDALTGPARRGDISTVEKQSASFENPVERQVYDAMSKAILTEFGF